MPLQIGVDSLERWTGVQDLRVDGESVQLVLAFVLHPDGGTQRQPEGAIGPLDLGDRRRQPVLVDVPALEQPVFGREGPFGGALAGRFVRNLIGGLMR